MLTSVRVWRKYGRVIEMHIILKNPFQRVVYLARPERLEECAGGDHGTEVDTVLLERDELGCEGVLVLLHPHYVLLLRHALVLAPGLCLDQSICTGWVRKNCVIN